MAMEVGVTLGFLGLPRRMGVVYLSEQFDGYIIKESCGFWLVLSKLGSKTVITYTGFNHVSSF